MRTLKPHPEHLLEKAVEENLLRSPGFMTLFTHSSSN